MRIGAVVRCVRLIRHFAEHKVLPQHVETYKSLIAPYYTGIANGAEFDTRLTGSFEVVVGDVDTFSQSLVSVTLVRIMCIIGPSFRAIRRRLRWSPRISKL